MEFFLVPIFPHSDWIQRDTKYLSVFSPTAGKYVPEKSPYSLNLDTPSTLNTLLDTLNTQNMTKISGKPLCIYCFAYLYWYDSIRKLLVFEFCLSMSACLKIFMFKIPLRLLGLLPLRSLVCIMFLCFPNNKKKETMLD